MSKIVILETLAQGDVLLVRGTVDGEPVEARGWLSATRNHVCESDFEEVKPGCKHRCAGRHHKVGAKPREMTKAEARAYCERLLREAVAPAAATPAPVKLF